MAGDSPHRVSVVIPTFERLESCRRAVVSALSQEPAPLEVIVADDGSNDQTPSAIAAWAAEEPRLRYIRIPRNTGGPGAARNAGVEAARGEWIAFLDDDDEWLPGKLATQVPLLGAGYDVVGGDALRISGDRYLGLKNDVLELGGRGLEAANQVITSTAIVRRGSIASVGGFPTERWARGVEDYGLWLMLSDAGARFALVAEPLVRYDDTSTARLSSAVLLREAAAVRLLWRHWRRRVGDFGRIKVLARRLVGLGLLSARSLRARIASRGGDA